MQSFTPPKGETLAQLSAHANAAAVLIGEAAELCAFDEGNAEERAEHVHGAVAAVLALHQSAI